MPENHVDFNTLQFLLYDVHRLEEILSYPRYNAYDLESTEMILKSVMDFTKKEVAPFFREMDAEPACFENGKVRVHPQVPVYMKKCGDLGLLAGPLEAAAGGMQLPGMVVSANMYIQEGANNHLPGYAGLTIGAAELLVQFSSMEIQERFVPRMISGEWAGTMCLTEPQAGSSLSDILTEAKPEDDKYLLSGQKIFISGGDYEGIENVVHLVLARISGAPAGTRGISLFVVPKMFPASDGTLLSNDVSTIGDFQKLGQKGYCTTHLSFGDKGTCRGWLVGEPDQGLRYMFQMMNSARIGVGRGAAAITMAAYLSSLAYARERPQGRKVTAKGTKDVAQEQTLIINHSDVKRMLLRQKVIAEGALSLILLSARYQDLALAHPDQKKRDEYHLLLEILTPVAKTYPAEKGIESVSTGLQVLGGYGFCEDYLLQQYYRDIRIFSIYEGTTGIQSQDLLARKMTMQNGKAFQLLYREIMNTIEITRNGDLAGTGNKLEKFLDVTRKVIDHLMKFAAEGDYGRFLADATLVMELMGNLVVGWQWLAMGIKSKEAISEGCTKLPESFHQAKLYALDYCFMYELPAVDMLADVIMNNNAVTSLDSESLFPNL